MTTRLTAEVAIELAWGFLRSEKYMNRVQNEPHVHLWTGEERASLGFPGNTEWVVGYPRRLRRGIQGIDPATVGVIVDDATGECRFVEAP